jgi:hypothetical protein
MTSIKLGNRNYLSVSDDQSNLDTMILGNGNDDTVSAAASQYDAITLGNGTGDTVNASMRTAFTFAAALMLSAAFAPSQSRAANLTTLVNFDGVGGARPFASLLADTNGNLFGTTSAGGLSCPYLSTGNVSGCGTVFEIAKTASGYASTPTTLVNFNGTDGAYPTAGLIVDASGNLFSTTLLGGSRYGTTSEGYGTVFEITKSTTGTYASTPITLYNFCAETNCTDGANPFAGLFIANGNLLGTTVGYGAYNGGTAFEITKSTTGTYASTSIILYSFCAETNCTDGGVPYAGLIADASGNLFGTASWGGLICGYLNNSGSCGTVFEFGKDASTSSGYASTPTILAKFNLTNGAAPEAGLIFDAKGNLFGGTTAGGGAPGCSCGTVFEIARDAGTSSGYASTPIVLASLGTPRGSLIADAVGNLFGTTVGGGTYGGTVFEIAKTASGYASTPTTLVNFNGTDGAAPYSSLIADAKGNLFGTTLWGGGHLPTVELRGAVRFSRSPAVASSRRESWPEHRDRRIATARAFQG